MDKYIDIVENALKYGTEREWLEFKENQSDAHIIGEYISALSNAAALKGEDFGYVIWGVRDEDHKICGTHFDFHKSFRNEPLEHYLARQLTPEIRFSFHEITLNGKRVVVLEIPAATKIPTSFNVTRYARIGSSKVNLAEYPEREAELFVLLHSGKVTMETLRSEYQDLTFERLFTYYAGKKVSLNEKTFRKNLGLLTEDGSYNLLAQLLSDDCHMPIRVSVFTGETKSSPLYSIREFGNTCILLALDKVLEYADVINLIQVDETDRMLTRKDVPLFDMDAFREAAVNAFVHNKWVDGNAPMITVYSDRIEILSRGALAKGQTVEGFYLGESVPVNQKLSDIFLQLHISERSGRGVPTIIETYGKDVFDFRENSIAVTIPFNRIVRPTGSDRHTSQDENDGEYYKVPLNPRRQKILDEIRKNPGITQAELIDIIGIGKTAIQNNISFLKENDYIYRVGSKKTGYWKLK